MIYDVIIVGAGPAGLQAAVTSAAHGLKTALIEKRNDVSRITRACCQEFVMDDGYEAECLRLKPGKVVFTRNNFEVDYDGPLVKVIEKTFTSPGGHRVLFAREDRSPFAIKFDKGMLLGRIWEKSKRLGVDLMPNTVAYNARDRGKDVEVHVVSKGRQSILEARKLIIADGANSRIADALGMNRERTFFTTILGIMYTLQGVRDFEPATTKFFMGLAYQSRAPVIIGPSLAGGTAADLLVMGSRHEPPEEIFLNFRTKGPSAFMFAHAEVVDKTGSAVKVFSPMRVPYFKNALAIGDVAAYGEVETQGALMCGFHAGNAVLLELEEDGGFEEYARWWQGSFEFLSEEYLRIAQGYALVPTYKDDELDYLFALIAEERLEGTISPYRSPRLMWNSILNHKEKIAKEKPELYAKIEKNQSMTLRNTFSEPNGG